MASKFPPLPSGQFGTIVADPPWRFQDTGSRAAPSYRGKGRADQRYDVLDWEDIASLGVESIAAPDAFLFLWIPEAMRETIWIDHDNMAITGLHRLITKAWGFTVTGNTMVWVKGRHVLVDKDGKETTLANKRRPVVGAGFRPHVGLGHYLRNAHETCLVCKRGNPKRLSGGVPSIIHAPRTEHSAKPDESYQAIERFSLGPRIDLFGRGYRPGWMTWGDGARIIRSGCPACKRKVDGTPAEDTSGNLLAQYKCHGCGYQWTEQVPR